MSALFGLIFTWLPESHPPVFGRSRGLPIVTAAVCGLLLWPLNAHVYGYGYGYGYVIAPFVGWEWFACETEPLVQAAAHLSYGAVPGLYLERRLRSGMAVSS